MMQPPVPVGAVLDAFCRAFADRINQRWQEAKGTASIEFLLVGVGALVGIVATVYARSDRPGWDMMPWFLTDGVFGRLKLLIVVLRFVSIMSGNWRFRRAVAQADFILSGSVAITVWRALPGAILSAALMGDSLANLYIMGRIEKAVARGGGGS